MLQRHDFDVGAPTVILRAGRPGPDTTVIELIADDLPCPWCGRATHETDARCEGCGRRFG